MKESDDFFSDGPEAADTKLVEEEGFDALLEATPEQAAQWENASGPRPMGMVFPPALLEQAAQVYRNDQGELVNQDGEIIDFPAVLRGLGWREMPSLPDKPTKEEVAEFEAKVNEIGAIVVDKRERAARKLAQANAMAKPFLKAAEFWEEFAAGLAKALAPFKLPTFKSGKNKGGYSAKTMVLEDCSFSFRGTAGGFYVHNKDEVADWLEKYCPDWLLSEFGARKSIVFDSRVFCNKFPKVLESIKAKMAKGEKVEIQGLTLDQQKDGTFAVSLVIPGTGTRNGDPLKAVSVSFAKDQGGVSEESDSD